MISPIGSGYSSPVSIYVPDNLPEIQDSSLSSSSGKKGGRIRTGIAECRDSFEQIPSNHQQNVDEKGYKWESNYGKLNLVVESQKTEQAKAYRPDQRGVAPLHPAINPVSNHSSLAADLSANMLSMIRV